MGRQDDLHGRADSGGGCCLGMHRSSRITVSGSAFQKAMAEALPQRLKKLNPKGRGKQTAGIH